jgi:tetratricopeptide (TPR) repeat protein
LRNYGATAEEAGAEFADAGLWEDGIDVLRQAVVHSPGKATAPPIVYYYLGDFAEKLGSAAQAAEYRRFAATESPDYVFPFQWEVISVLRRAMEANPLDARAPYYLGNVLFDWQPDEAIALWEKAAALDPKLSLAWRNLAQAYAHQPGDASLGKAIADLEKAVALGEAYPTHFAELDQLYHIAGASPEKRLALLEKHQAAVIKKDEGLASLVELKTFAGKPDEAIALLEARTFSVWEGGTSFDTGRAWTDAHMERGMQRLAAKRFAEALVDFEQATQFPENLRASEGAAGSSRHAEASYWMGCAHEALGQAEAARRDWSEAAKDLAAAEGRGAPRPDGRGAADVLALRAGAYFRALALRRLGDNARAEALFRELVSTGAAALAQSGSLAEPGGPIATVQSRHTHAAAAHYLVGLGCAGLAENERARAEFAAALKESPDHFGAKLALNQL